MKKLVKCLAVILAGSVSAASAEPVLLMAEEDGCYWCERWHEEIAAVYPKTPEGKAAPLQRFDLYGEHPEGVAFATRVTFTPTFILVDEGVELGRIEGYPGEDFFWGLLGMMLDRAGVAVGETG
ncbi:MAG: thioredoxin fold domain-containing protein [Paracoccaceae bacterium]